MTKIPAAIRSTAPRRCSRSSARPMSSTVMTAQVTRSSMRRGWPIVPSRRSTAGPRGSHFSKNTSQPQRSHEPPEGKEPTMCSYIVEKAKLLGSAKGPNGWMRIDTANVYYDHPFHSPLDHALGIDFINEAEGGRELVAVELSAESARLLVEKILAALASGEMAHATTAGASR